MPIFAKKMSVNGFFVVGIGGLLSLETQMKGISTRHMPRIVLKNQPPAYTDTQLDP